MLFYFSDTQNLELRRQEREIKEGRTRFKISSFEL